MSGDVITRCHRSPRLRFYAPQDSDFPIPLKYVDVHRHAETNLDSPSERTIDDYWNVSSNLALSDQWTGKHNSRSSGRGLRLDTNGWMAG